MKHLLIFLLMLSGVAHAQLPKAYRKWKLGGVVTTPPSSTTSAPSVARVTGQIPFDNIQLYQVDVAPPIAIDSLFIKQPPSSGNLVQALNAYGQTTTEYDNILTYDTTQNVIVNMIKFGYPYGGYGGRELKIYSTDRTTGVESLMWQQPATLINNVPQSQTLSQDYNPSKLRIRVKSNGFPAYLNLYGSHVPVTPQPLTFTKYPFGGHTGINAFSWNMMVDTARSRPNKSAFDILEKLGNIRLYFDFNDMSRSPGNVQLPVTWKGYNLDSCLLEMKKRNIWVQVDLKEMTDDLNSYYPSIVGTDTLVVNNERIMTDRPRMDITDPASYTRVDEMVYQFCARYAKGNPPANTIKSADKKTGMDVITVLEVGNEYDKWWQEGKKGPTRMNGRTLVAFMTAVYNAAKRADPTLPVGIPGLASTHQDLLMEAKPWVIATRGYKPDGVTPNWPWDYINGHAYQTTANEQNQSGSKGKVIEQTNFINVVKTWHRANAKYLSNMELIIGESGYDVGQFTKYAAIPPTGSSLTPRQWAGVMNLRVALFNAKWGIRRTLHYQWDDRAAPDNQYDGFGTMGFIYEQKVGGVKLTFPYSSASYMIEFNSLMKSHVHAAEISASPLVDKWSASGQPDVYTIYSPTQANTTGTYTLAVPAGKTTATLYQVQDGVLTPLSSSLTITSGNVSVPYSEIPKVVIFN